MEMDESEYIIGSDGFSEGWTAQADLNHIWSILIEIMVGQ
jgi:hypothetical protein